MPLASGSKIALVHGFATDAVFSVFRPALGADAGFEAFREEVEKGEVTVFRWGIERGFSALQILGLLPVLKLYRDEERRAADPEWQEKLFQFLEGRHIETVVCHSLGCRFLLDTINSLGLPSSLKKIVFVQADISRSQFITDETVLSKMAGGSLKWMNVYCAWDQSLLASTLLTGHWRYGMSKVKHPYIENRFMALKTLPNLHTCSIRSDMLKKLI